MPGPTIEEMDQKAMDLLERLVVCAEKTSKATADQTKELSEDLNRIAFALEGIMERTN